MKPTLHVISHSHWDREWYISFEEHRMRLIELLDSIIEKMEIDESYRYFHLDGQTIVIEDYLEIRPEMRDRLYALIHAGRIQVGPWYILQDEYLTSGEANVRNMIEGLKFCKENGIDPVMTGYMPDAFGNIAQLPQILAGFGIDNAVFGRGTSIILADNQALESDRPTAKELIWSGADGSEIIGVMFTNWYDNANELPTSPERVKEVYGELIRKTKAASVTGQLLAMNGCDHQPLQRDLPESIAAAREIFGAEIEIKHSNFKDFIELMRKDVDKFAHVSGELAGQQTSGECLLIDTASTHMPLKIKNHKGQNLLAQQAEPISAVASALGEAYRTDMLRYSWKKLMQCHPHDSICCCSCDDVTREMSIRFDKSRQTAEYVLAEAGRYAAGRVDTSAIADDNIIIFHSNPKKGSYIINYDVYLDDFAEASTLTVINSKGEAVPCEVEYKGHKFTYTLPKDSFRKVKYKHCYAVKFPATLEGIGCFAFALVAGKKAKAAGLNVSANAAENAYVTLTIAENGTLTVTDKASGRSYEGLNSFEDTGDRGNSYNYIQSCDKLTVYPENAAEVSLIVNNGFEATFEIKRSIAIPAALDADKNRSAEVIMHTVTSRVTLTAASPRIDIETEFDNLSENHRLRAIFPTDTSTDTVFADGQFDVIKRSITPWEGWINPSNTQRMQAFFGVEDADNGIMVASKGLLEYEVLRDGRNTMALTLLRATGEVGDWGVFPTPDMQLKRNLKVNYSIIAYSAENRAKAFDSAYSFAGDFTAAFQTDRHEGTLAPDTALITLRGDYAVFSTLKAAENGKGAVLRVYNVSEEAEDMSVSLDTELFSAAFQTNLAETDDTALTVQNGSFGITAGAKKIKTFRIK